jgi:hypothetical protein
MSNQWVVYNEDVKKETGFLYELLRNSGYNVDIRLGDVYGPERSAMCIQINSGKRYILCDYNSLFWRIGFFKAEDEEGALGINFPIKYNYPTSEFYNWLVEFLRMIDVG